MRMPLGIILEISIDISLQITQGDSPEIPLEVSIGIIHGNFSLTPVEFCPIIPRVISPRDLSTITPEISAGVSPRIYTVIFLEIY